MSWLPISKKLYHEYFAHFEEAAARPRDLEKKYWDRSWDRIVVEDGNGKLEAIEWRFRNKPKLRYILPPIGEEFKFFMWVKDSI